MSDGLVTTILILLILLGSYVNIQAWTLQHHQQQQQARHPMHQGHRFPTMLKMSSTNNSEQQQVTSRPKGSAAIPTQKQKILTMGNGGYLGGILYGYLQRTSSIYTTGIGNIRSIGATADTSIRLNRILNKHFVLANADESNIKLTNLTCIDTIKQRMIGYDTIILGNSLYLEEKKITANTYEVSPNDKVWEIYWDQPKGSYTNYDQSIEANTMKDIILRNFISAAQLAKMKHIFLVITTTTNASNNNDADKDRNQNILQQVQASGIPFTCIYIPYKLFDKSSQGYTYQEGILCKNLVVESVTDSVMTDTYEYDDDTTCIYREDVAALCVQAIQSCDWDRPQRYLTVRIATSSVSTDPSNAPPRPPSSSSSGVPKRMDQLWCMNSYLLEEQLNRIS